MRRKINKPKGLPASFEHDFVPTKIGKKLFTYYHLGIQPPETKIIRKLNYIDVASWRFICLTTFWQNLPPELMKYMEQFFFDDMEECIFCETFIKKINMKDNKQCESCFNKYTIYK
jgi:hypothetical protein